MRWLEGYEGGYVNHPQDPGGATMRGVTQRVYDAFRRATGLPTQAVRLLTDAEHHAIYIRQYWNPIWGDQLPDGVDGAVFDYAVNSGPARAVRDLQRIVGTKADGVMGLMTFSAVKEWVAKRSAAELVVALCEARMRFLRGLKTFATFGRGWTRRVVGDKPGVQDGDIGVVDRCVKLSRGFKEDAIPAPKRPAPGKAIPERDEGWLDDLIAAFIRFLNGFRKGAMA